MSGPDFHAGVAQVERLMLERALARGRRDFARADALKAEILAVRVPTSNPRVAYRPQILDGADGTSWQWQMNVEH